MAQRWLAHQEQLQASEAADPSEAAIRAQIEAILAEEARPGAPPTFSVEQVVQIVAIACEELQPAGAPSATGQQRKLPPKRASAASSNNSPPAACGDFWGEAQLQPHRCRYWLNAKPEEPEQFEAQVRESLRPYLKWHGARLT